MPDYSYEKETERGEQMCRAETSTHEAQDAQKASAAWNKYVAGLAKGGGRSESLGDLTPSQRAYVENLRAIEKANPEATANDIAMAISLLLWEGRIWDQSGEAADVATPYGVPLVLDYAGGEGYEDVELDREQQEALRKQREVHDRHGRESGVAHTFPAVAAQAGREDTTAGEYNRHMVTAGGDFIQDVATVIVEQRLDGTFREAEARDNERAVKIAEGAEGGDRPLSELMVEQFRAENAEVLEGQS